MHEPAGALLKFEKWLKPIILEGYGYREKALPRSASYNDL